MQTRTGRRARHGATLTKPTEADYPDSDGRPMADTPLLGDEMIRIKQTLVERYADVPNVSVWCNVMLYYIEDNTRVSIAPDVFVAKGVPKPGRERRVYRTWVEGGPPTVVFELISKRTRREDMDPARKPAVFAEIGVSEYFLYDPPVEFMRPPLQGFRRRGLEWVPIAPEPDGTLRSDELGLDLRLVDGQLRMFDTATGRPLLSPAEQLAETNAALQAALARIAELEGRSQPRNGHEQ